MMPHDRTSPGASRDAAPTTLFDETDELLARLFELCSPEQRARGESPREVLARLSPAERAHLLRSLPPSLREEVRLLLGR